MSNSIENTKKRAELRRLVKDAHNVIDEYAELRLSGNWEEHDLDTSLRRAMTAVLDHGVTRKPVRLVVDLCKPIPEVRTENIQ